ncbi:uncharacterized protein LOC114293376 isoform X3 [Camellia sinensis]|uniref:uncharacterized protein LOC114293376 isoform X3 n=1 Tax=Camellia sinensis TaxID=4442 RepID=UPI001035E4A8|nr:uncharacterized protein LOC114293376 isoform X3 [Camellia sinensis]
MVMALEPHASQNPDKIHTDVLLEARQACYKARDAFYACLEMESNKKPTEIASVGLLYPIECKKSRDQFVKQCRPTWVKHFDRQYASKKRLQRLLDDSESRRVYWVTLALILPQSLGSSKKSYYVIQTAESGILSATNYTQLRGTIAEKPFGVVFGSQLLVRA